MHVKTEFVICSFYMCVCDLGNEVTSAYLIKLLIDWEEKNRVLAGSVKLFCWCILSVF